jgi:hypothetical protein
METRKRVLRHDHPDTLTNIANVFWNQGRCKEAEELFVEVMKTSFEGSGGRACRHND